MSRAVLTIALAPIMLLAWSFCGPDDRGWITYRRVTLADAMFRLAERKRTAWIAAGSALLEHEQQAPLPRPVKLIYYSAPAPAQDGKWRR